MMEMHVCDRNGTRLKAFALGDKAEVLIGRDDSCDVQIRSSTVSREHCTIEVDGEELILRDLGSTAGTYVNGRKVDRVRLEDGIEITVGPAVLKFFEADI